MTPRTPLAVLAVLVALGSSACALPGPAASPVPTVTVTVTVPGGPPDEAKPGERGPEPGASGVPVVEPTTDLAGDVDAYVTAVDAGGRLTVDVVQFFSGDEAIEQAAARRKHWVDLECPDGPYAGGPTTGCSIPNDYLIVNDNPRLRVLPLASGATVTLIDWEGHCCDPRPSSREALASRVADGPVLVNFTVDAAGRIASVRETFVP